MARDKVIFGFELTVAGIVLTATVLVVALTPTLIPIALLSGSGVGGLVAFLKRKTTEG